RGSDISEVAISNLEHWLETNRKYNNVELLRQEAINFSGIDFGSTDTVVINSVAQYFPNIDYLVMALTGAIERLSVPGRIFIGDIRHFGLIRLFHSSVQLARAPADLTVEQLRHRIRQAVGREKELTIDPRFFSALPYHLPRINRVDILLKR